MQTNDFRPAERVNRGLVSALEQRVLMRLACNLPDAVKPDHLTVLGFGSLLAVGFSYWYARYSTVGLWLVILFLALNWFGDSLDGTLARARGKQRPRYGFYVDHVLDACGSVFLFAGLALSGYMSERIAVGLLVAYFLVSIEVYLATYAVGRFHLSFAAFGPTELRLLLVAREHCAAADALRDARGQAVSAVRCGRSLRDRGDGRGAGVVHCETHRPVVSGGAN